MGREYTQNDISVKNYYELTTQQKNILNLQKYYDGTAISNICGAIIYDEARDLERLERSVRQVIGSQTALRLRLSNTDPVFQYLSEDQIDIDIRSFSDESELDDFARKIAEKPMRLYDSPMCAFTIFSLGTRSGIAARLSHLIADAWSFGLLADRIDSYYRCQGREEKSPTEKDIPAGDYLSYVQDEHKYRLSERYEKDRRFWQEKYHLRPENCPVRLFEAAKTQDIRANRIHKWIHAGLSRQIRSFCSENKVTEAIVFESAVLLYLSRINPEVRTCTIGVPVLNRIKLKEKQTAGMFISTMPLRADINASQTAMELLESVSSAKREMFRHQRYPYEEILRTVRSDHGFTGNLFDVMVSVQNSRIHGNYDFHTKWYPSGYCEVPLVVSVDQRDSGKEYSITADYQTAVFPDEAEVYALLDRIECIISRIVTCSAENNIPVSEIDILPKREQNLILDQFNDTIAEYPAEKCVHELFKEQVQRTPNSIALTCEGQEITYKQLDEKSDSLALFLRKKGVKRNEVVPIISRRDWRIIVSMLAVLKAGGAYMPVSPDYPVDRISTMLKIAESRIALCYGFDEKLTFDEKLNIEKIDLAGFDFSKTPGPAENINCSDDLCYIIFTSGSTGTPKGVIIRHRNFVNTLTWRSQNKNYTSETIVDISPVITDTFCEDTVTSLVSGKRLVLVRDRTNTTEIERNIRSVRGSFSLMTTPSFFGAVYSSCKKVKWDDVILVGEQLSIYNRDLFYEGVKKIHNEYGPSECSVCATYKVIEKDDQVITIGRPITNTQVYILDSHQKLLPVGVAGEICIAGAGVGKGYLNRPDLTAERFIPNPFRTEENGHGKVLYRTGDLGRWRMDGELECLGRIDTQVKIRGLRIELGEIESAMAETEGIGLVAAAAQKDAAGRQYLVGYYTSGSGIDEKAMRKHLAEKLPNYMVPNYFIRLDSMPMTASGKTDRKNLPVPEINLSDREYVPPVTDTEKILCEVIAQVLSLDRVGVTDDFFELGGDSLGAISVAALAHEKGIEIGLQTLFDHPDVRDLCAALEDTRNAGHTGSEEGHALPQQDCRKYRELLHKNTIDVSAAFEKKEIGNVFLTGATGFLGAHVLDALMRQTDGTIYCLVRGSQDKDPCQRLADSLRWYFGETYTREIGKRIIPVEGDIERAGLSDMLPEDVQTVIHTAATVKHYGTYDHFKKINVEGTRHAAVYARRVGAKFIHISTVSVSGNAIADGSTVHLPEEDLFFGETDFYIGQPLENVYIRSKFEAEKVVMDEILDNGLKARIIRVGNLTNRASDLRFQPNYESNAFLKRMKAILELGLFPDYLLPLYSEFSPVDLTAEGIVKIIQYANEQMVFHLYSNKPLANQRMLSILRSNGISLRTVTGEEFHREVERSLQSKEKEFIFKSLHLHMDSNGRLIYDSNIHIKNDFTAWFMSQIGFEWNEIDEDYVKGYLEYFRKAGFFNV